MGIEPTSEAWEAFEMYQPHAAASHTNLTGQRSVIPPDACRVTSGVSHPASPVAPLRVGEGCWVRGR